MFNSPRFLEQTRQKWWQRTNCLIPDLFSVRWHNEKIIYL